MIVVVCVCSLGEEYVCGRVWVWVCIGVGVHVWRGGVRGRGAVEGYVFCCDNLYYGFNFNFIQYVCLLSLI